MVNVNVCPLCSDANLSDVVVKVTEPVAKSALAVISDVN